MTLDTIIVGAGLAGLACARELASRGISFEIYDAADGVGGRARTDVVDGFLLDRGFQVYLDAYPEGRRILDYGALDLRPFEPGAILRTNGRFTRITDPWRRPLRALGSLFAPVGGIRDKLRIGKLRRSVVAPSLDELAARPDVTTLARLREFEFSDAMIERFFRPFFGGVFLERDLETSSRFFDFVFRMFSIGSATLPARGMGEIAAQLVSRVPEDSVHLGRRVVSVEAGQVRFDNGDTRRARSVVLAVDGGNLARLSGHKLPPAHDVTCVYFACEQAPFTEARIALDAEEGAAAGPVNNVCVPNAIAPTYAPNGHNLVSCSVLGSGHGRELVDAIRKQMRTWFGSQVDDWRHLRSYEIVGALPAHPPGATGVASNSSDLIVCGDHAETPSIQGAFVSGRLAAERIAAQLDQSK